MRDISADQQGKSSSKIGSGCVVVFLVAFCAFFILVGVMLTGTIARDFLRDLQTRWWASTPCKIVASQVVEVGDDFKMEVEYRYRFEGRAHTSRQLARKSEKFSDYSKAQRLTLRYAPGAEVTCYVNPAAPHEAVLERGNLWSGLGILFPLIFVTIGGGGLVLMARGALRHRRQPAEVEKPLSAKAPGRVQESVPEIFCFVFLIFGSVIFWFMTVRPVSSILQARGWEETPCVVISSEVRSHSSDDGTTYSVNILYGYKFEGREYRSNRYHFMGGASSGRAGKAEIVKRHRPGKKTVCYVNPNDPTEAVLERGFTADLLWGLLPMLFMLGGFFGLFHFRNKRNQPKPTSPIEKLNAFYRDKSPKVLKPSLPRFGKLLGAVIVAAFWNGITSVFVWHIAQGWIKGRPEWIPTIFMIPFVLIGLALIGLVIYTGLGLFNPKPKITIDPGAPALGEQLFLRYELSGRTHVLRRLRIWLEGREEAQYRRGTTTATDKSVFAKLELLDSTDRLSINSGQTRVTIPSGLMHSWSAENNKIIWTLHVHGDISVWPDVKDEFPLVVLPQESTSHVAS